MKGYKPTIKFIICEMFPAGITQIGSSSFDYRCNLLCYLVYEIRTSFWQNLPH